MKLKLAGYCGLILILMTGVLALGDSKKESNKPPSYISIGEEADATVFFTGEVGGKLAPCG